MAKSKGVTALDMPGRADLERAVVEGRLDPWSAADRVLEGPKN